MKTKVDKLDVDKLVTVPVDLSKLIDVVKNDVVKKTEYDELRKKVNAIQSTDTSGLVKKTDYNTEINEIKKKKILIMIIVISILLHNNLIILLQDEPKQI